MSKSATSAWLGELDGAIVINLADRVRPLVEGLPMLSAWVLLDHNMVSHGVCVVLASGILAFVVLDDKLLLSLLDVVPIGLEANVQERVSAEHKLCWRGSECGVDSGVDCSSNCT